MKLSRILVVDDNHLMLTLLVGLLQQEGYRHVDKAYSGKEAVSKFLQTRPDVIFMDIEMPDFSGIETLKAIKEFGTTSQVVMVTATPTAENVKQAKFAGACGFLVKPVSAAKLSSAVDQCIEQAGKTEGDIELFICD